MYSFFFSSLSCEKAWNKALPSGPTFALSTLQNGVSSSFS
jgi:hypothetical protein